MSLTMKQNSIENTNTNQANRISNSNSLNDLTLIENILKDVNLNDSEKRIITEYLHLLEKSKQLFNGLRDLPQYGYKNNQWQTYFGRTFDVYTKLWKFQQQHRQILDTKYNLKRWQIGDIASKIGQLYYHYYLRTSESNYLNESYSFYQAIQTRSYYSKANKEEKPDLMVKKLRYLARFIVVCLLLKRTKQVKELIRDISREIDEYVKIYDPEDQLEWQLVRNEINDFIECDNLLAVNSEYILFSSRLNITKLPAYINIFASSTTHSLCLSEAIIIGNTSNQIKFSELSMDMFRMLQAVEREPSETTNNIDRTVIGQKSANTTNLYLHNLDKTETANGNQTQQHRENPRKYLLYKPSVSQSLAYISSAFKDLPPHSVLLIYISADSCETHMKIPVDASYDYGGVRTNNKKELQSQHSSSSSEVLMKKSSHLKDIHCIYPGDLYPYLRKPLFLIVESSNSIAFQNFPNLFGQPFISIMSPIQLPSVFEETCDKGNLFTLFLTCPLVAFAYVCNIYNFQTKELYDKCQLQIDKIFAEIAQTITKSKQLDLVFLQFYADEFLRTFILRFVFCYCTLRLHRGFKGIEYYPTSQPQISNDILENVNTHKLILDLTNVLSIRHLFMDMDQCG